MKLKKMSFRNFKSYSNVLTEISFDDTSSLNLIIGMAQVRHLLPSAPHISCMVSWKTSHLLTSPTESTRHSMGRLNWTVTVIRSSLKEV